MRIGNIQNAENSHNNTYKILAVDDEAGIIDSLSKGQDIRLQE